MAIDPTIIALVTAVLTPVGLLGVAGINYMGQAQARKDARAAQAAASQAAEAALGAEHRQIAVAKETNVKLSDLQDTAHVIHTIVNSHHTRLLQLVANLTARVAAENPHDVQAQEDAKQATLAIGQHLEGVEVKDIDPTKT